MKSKIVFFINRLVSFIIGKEKRNKEIKNNTDLINEYVNMCEDEFIFEYINAKVKLAYRKNITITFFVTFIITIITGVWIKFFDFIILMNEKVTFAGDEINRASFIVSMFLTIFIICILIIFLVFLTASYRASLKEMEIITEAKNRRD